MRPFATRRVASSRGAFALVTFIWRQMKVTAPPGAHPGQLPYAVVNKTNKQAQRPANQTLKALAPKHPKKLSRIPPFACAWGVAFAGWRWHRRVPVHRQLACRVCPNRALSARREFRGTPRKCHDTGCPSQREGSQAAGATFFWVLFFGRRSGGAQKSTSPAGRNPASKTKPRRRHTQKQIHQRLRRVCLTPEQNASH